MKRNSELGAVYVEYAEILVLVTVGAALATVPLGLYLLRFFDFLEDLVRMPYP